MTKILIFFSGIAGALLVWYIKSLIQRYQIKKFTNHYLSNSVLSQCDELIHDYEIIIEYIREYKKGHLTLKAFESFNIDNLAASTPQEYYLIYKKNFELFNDIKNMINYISTDLPHHVKRQYFDLINSHLKEKNKVGDVEHSKHCSYCLDRREIALKQAQMRIDEVKKLKEFVNTLTKN